MITVKIDKYKNMVKLTEIQDISFNVISNGYTQTSTNLTQTIQNYFRKHNNLINYILTFYYYIK